MIFFKNLVNCEVLKCNWTHSGICFLLFLVSPALAQSLCSLFSSCFFFTVPLFINGFLMCVSGDSQWNTA